MVNGLTQATARQRYPEIGELVTAVMSENSINSPELAAAAISLGQNHGYDFGLNPGSLETYLSQVRRGSIWGDGNSDTRNAARRMERLSWLMLALKVPEEHPLIMQLRGADTRFKYPPENQEGTLAGLLESYAREC